MQRYDYDLLVIGAGSGGVRAARMAAAYGARVAVAEQGALGGTCVNAGCIPKKLFVYGAHFAEDFEDAAGYGWRVPEAAFDWSALRAGKDREIARLNGIYRSLLDDAGVDILAGRATFEDARAVRVGDRVATARHILIATGSRPFVPDFPGSSLAITSDDAFHLPELPRRALVIGGGYIAVEFAGIFAGLGVETTLAYRGPLLLRGFDAGVRRFVLGQMRGKGIAVRHETRVASIERADGALRCRFAAGGAFDADLVLAATGRAPAVDSLGLEAAGVALGENGAVLVDADYRASVPGIFAIGDVIGGAQLTPVAIHEGMCVAHNLFNGGFASGRPRRVRYENVPTAVFCQPNIGCVGPTEEEARARHARIDVFESEFRPLKHTVGGRAERAFMKLLVNRDDDRVVAAHMCGPDAGEIVQGLAVAINAGATKAQFDATIGIHPTTAEEFVTMRKAVAR